MESILFSIAFCCICYASYAHNSTDYTQVAEGSTWDSVENTELNDTIIVYGPLNENLRVRTSTNKRFNPRFVTFGVGAIKNERYFELLKQVTDSFYRRSNTTPGDILFVSFYYCEWSRVRRFEEFQKKPNPTIYERMSIDSDIFRPLKKVDCVSDNYFIKIDKKNFMNDYISNSEEYDLVYMNSVLLAIPKMYEGLLIEPIGAITYKYTAEYEKERYYSGIQPFPLIDDYFYIKEGHVKPLTIESPIIQLLLEDY